MDSGIDFSYFNTGPMPYSFLGFPPTPQSQTPQTEDYRGLQNSHDHYDPAFAAFQQNFQYDPSQFIAQPQAHHMGANRSPPAHHARHSITSIADNSVDQIRSVDISPDDQGAMIRSSSEEKDNFTPQQNKRKAQNRAAQRAFRERKEKHVKDLEAQNTSLQHDNIQLQSEMERLRHELAKVTTENEILRATSGSTSNGPTPFLTEPDELVGPLGYTPTDYSSKLRQSKDGTTNWTPNSKWAQFGTIQQVAVDDDSGEPLLNAGATWDYIQAHELFKQGLVDVGDVCERLKKMARCDGQGPVFQEGDIRRAISESAVAGGRDELI